jgi:hypothetical protein
MGRGEVGSQNGKKINGKGVGGFHDGKKIHNGCPYAGNIFTFKNQFYSTHVFYIKNKVRIKYPSLEFSLTNYGVLSSHEGYFLPYVSHSFYRFLIFPFTIYKDCHQRPHRPRWPPLSGPVWPRLAPLFPPRALPRIGAPPL